MATIYMIIWTDKKGIAREFYTEYSSELLDIVSELHEEKESFECFGKEENAINYNYLNL